MKNFNLLRALKTDLSKHKSDLIDPLCLRKEFNEKASTDRRKSQDESTSQKLDQLKEIWCQVRLKKNCDADDDENVSELSDEDSLFALVSISKSCLESVESVKRIKTAHFAVHLHQQRQPEHESIKKQMHIKR